MLRVRLAVRKGHLLGVSVIGGEKHTASGRERRVDDLTDGGVGRFHRLERGFEVSGVTDHIGIREVDDCEIVDTASYRTDESGGHTGCTHFRLAVVRGNLGRRHELAVLTLERWLAPAVEEIGDVRVLLRLGGVELPEASVGEDLGHRRDRL